MARLQIFISYRSTDRPFVERLAADLRQIGNDVWFDEALQRTGGQDWWANILAQIRACDVFVFALTDDALASTACQRELGYAEALRKRILPVIIRESRLAELPLALQRIQIIHFEGQTRAQAMDLTASLYNLPPAQPPPSPLPPEPPIPIPPEEERLNRIDQLLAGMDLSKEQQALILVELEDLIMQPAYRDKALARLRRFIDHADLTARIAARAETLIRQYGPSAPSAAGAGRRSAPRGLLIGLLIVAVVAIGALTIALQALQNPKVAAIATTWVPSFPPLPFTVTPTMDLSTLNAPTLNVGDLPPVILGATAGGTMPAKPSDSPLPTVLTATPPTGTPAPATPATATPAPATLAGEAATPRSPSPTTASPDSGACPLSRPIAVGLDVTAPPFEYSDPSGGSGDAIGFEVDLFKLIAQQQGITYQLLYTPAGDLARMVRAGDLDIAMTASPGRPGSDGLLYTTPHYLEHFVFVVSVASAAQYNALHDFDRRTIGVLENSFANNLIGTSGLISPTVSRYRDAQLAFRALTDGAVQGVLIDYSQAAHTLAVTADYPVLITSIQVGPRYPFAFAVRPGCTQLRDKLSEGLLAAVASGDYTEVAHRYFAGSAARIWGCPYTVQVGDTLSAIAQRFSSTADFIRRANGLSNDFLSLGQILIVSPEPKCAGEP